MSRILTREDENSYKESQQMITSMTKTIRPVKCKDHLEENYTNFCMSKDCMRALCPDCMERHTQFHKQNNTYPDLQSIKSVKIKSKQKLMEIKNNIDQLYDQIEDLIQNQNLDDSDEGIKKINTVRDTIIYQVNSYFDQLLDKYRARVSSLIEKDEKIKYIQDRLSLMSDEIEIMSAKMEGTAAQIDTFNEVQNLDLNSQLSDIEIQIQDILNIQQRQSIDIIVEESKIRMLKTDLVQYIRLGQYIFYDQQEQINQQAISQPQLSLIANQTPIQENKIQYQEEINTSFPDHVDTDPSFDNKYQQSNQNSFYKVDESQIAQIEVNQSSYFEKDCPHKIIPYYNTLNKNLYMIDATTFELRNQVSVNELIPDQGRTVITPRGDIYMIGGIFRNNDTDKVFKYDYTEEKFTERQSMIYARSSFAAVYAEKSIYVIGGKRDGQAISECEKYDILQNKWKAIANLNYQAFSSSVCTFGNNYLYKFGGIGPGQLQNNNYVERYDIQQNYWQIINLMHEDITGIHSIGPQKMFALFFNSGTIQISDSTIFVFGGQLEKKMQKSSFCFNIKKEKTNSQQNSMHVLNRFDYIPLPSAGSFTTNPIIHNNKIICLQNIDNPAGQGQISFASKRKLLVFDGTNWIESIQNFN
ncbi:hypothetical protein ABPG74_001308 [Tetrahymena malaccensis]